MNLTEEQIKANKEHFISLVNSISREGFRKEELLNKLETSDFFIAPASTKYHLSVKGGLCAHCLSVYNNILNYNEMKSLNLPEDSLKIVALFHDLSKMDFYQLDYRNKKIYCEEGSKFDNNGKFEWVTEPYYTIRPKESRMSYGNHEETAEFLTRMYIPLTPEESAAILNHMGGLGYDSNQHTANDVYEKNKLAILLFLADISSTFIDEKR